MVATPHQLGVWDNGTGPRLRVQQRQSKMNGSSALQPGVVDRQFVLQSP